MGAPEPPGRQCSTCVHFRGVITLDVIADEVELEPDAGYNCDAFPEKPGIPDEILRDRFDHTKQHEGDHGIRFKYDERLG